MDQKQTRENVCVSQLKEEEVAVSRDFARRFVLF